MTKKKTRVAQAAPGEKPTCFYIVNPRGAIHQVTAEHARRRLSQPGYREATPEEIADLIKRDGLQVADSPICKPFKPDARPRQAA